MATLIVAQPQRENFISFKVCTLLAYMCVRQHRSIDKATQLEWWYIAGILSVTLFIAIASGHAVRHLSVLMQTDQNALHE